MIPIAQALTQVLEAFEPLAAERVALPEALGRFTTEPVTARCDLPPFDHSAMDGYAVRADDLRGTGPWTLPVQGEARAGGPWPGPLAPGRALRIFTGAPLPAGADTVVIQEQTRALEGRVLIAAGEVRPGQHIRRRAEDVAAGEPLLPQVAQVGPGEIGLLASQGIGSLLVHRTPRVAVLSTGDELRDASAPAEPGTIVDSNGPALAAQIRRAGAQPWVLARAPDELEALRHRLRDGLRSDLLLTIGGVSVGTHDLVRDALRAEGVELDFWKVAVKPGKPVAFGRPVGGTPLAGSPAPVLGLPGNPVSAMVTFELFARPAIRRMLGDPRPHPPTRTVQLAAPLTRTGGRTELLRARLEDRGDGPPRAELHSRQGSGSLTSMAGIDALVVIPHDRTEIEPGEPLTAILLDAARGTGSTPFAGL